MPPAVAAGALDMLAPVAENFVKDAAKNVAKSVVKTVGEHVAEHVADGLTENHIGDGSSSSQQPGQSGNNEDQF